MTPESLGNQTVDRNAEHLRLLGIYHGVVAGFKLVVLIVFILLPLLLGPGYFAWLRLPLPNPGMLASQLLFGLFLGGLIVLITALNGWWLFHKRHWWSCVIFSCIECLSIPTGLILGVSAILVLRRPAVKVLFGQAGQDSLVREKQ